MRYSPAQLRRIAVKAVELELELELGAPLPSALQVYYYVFRGPRLRELLHVGYYSTDPVNCDPTPYYYDTLYPLNTDTARELLGR